MAVADFIADNIRKIQNALNSKLVSTVYDPFSFDVLYSDHKLTSISTATPAEAHEFISYMIAKTSPVDSILTSLIKVALLTYSIRYSGDPQRLNSVLMDYKPNRSLRSAEEHLLVVPRTKLYSNSRAFSVAAQKLWNNLPLDIRNSNTTLRQYFENC